MQITVVFVSTADVLYFFEYFVRVRARDRGQSSCESPSKHMNDDIPAILNAASRIAVVGLSEKPYRMSYIIAESLRAYGYTVLPVNPLLDHWNDLPCWPDLVSVPGPIDIVNVFRRSEHVAAVVDDAIAAGATVLWTQSGVADYSAAAKAETAGLQVVMDRCIAAELARR